MAGTTLQQSQEQLDAWLAASAAVASNQSYRMGDRELTRADANAILSQIKFWEARVKSLSAVEGGRRRTRYVVPG